MELDKLHSRILEGLSGKEREDFLAGLKLLSMDNPADREVLRESIRKAYPDFTEAQIDIFIEGRVRDLGYSSPSSGDDREALRKSFKKMHPDWTEKQLDIAVEGR